MSIRIEIEGHREAAELLEDLARRTGDMRPVLDAIGQILVSNTQQRFVEQRGPDGAPWRPLSPVTLARRRGVAAGAKILRDTGRLANSISYRADGGSVSLGSNVEYAGTHQYGAQKGEFGVRNGHQIPWGNVPARPFFGYSDQDQIDVLEVIQRYIDVSQPQSWWRRWLDRFRRWF